MADKGLRALGKGSQNTRILYTSLGPDASYLPKLKFPIKILLTPDDSSACQGPLPEEVTAHLGNRFCPLPLGEGVGGVPGSPRGAGSHRGVREGGHWDASLLREAAFPSWGGVGGWEGAVAARPAPLTPGRWWAWGPGGASPTRGGLGEVGGGGGGAPTTNHHPCGPGASPDKPSADPAHA